MKFISYWCPECGSCDTKLYDYDESDPLSEEELWICEDCGETFYPDDADSMEENSDEL